MKTPKPEDVESVDEFANPPRCDCDALDGVPHRHMRGGPEPLTDAELNDLTVGGDGGLKVGGTEEEDEAGDLTGILEDPAHAVIEVVSTFADKDALKSLLKAEKAGKGRVTVITAIEDRIAEL